VRYAAATGPMRTLDSPAAGDASPASRIVADARLLIRIASMAVGYWTVGGRLPARATLRQCDRRAWRDRGQARPLRVPQRGIRAPRLAGARRLLQPDQSVGRRASPVGQHLAAAPPGGARRGVPPDVREPGDGRERAEVGCPGARSTARTSGWPQSSPTFRLPDGQVDLGVDDLCQVCRRCVDDCPPRAIFEEKQLVRGERKWYVDFDRCVPYFTKTYGCSICIEVCPWSEPGRGPALSRRLLARRQRSEEGVHAR